MPPNRDTPAVPAVPATRLACDRCHDHKLRCDRSPITGEPCRRCARVKAECRYGRPRRFGRPRKRKDSTAEDVAAPSPGLGPGHGPAGVPAAAPQGQEPAAARRLAHRDSCLADIDSPAFYEVGDSCLGKDAMSLMHETELPSPTEMLLPEGTLYAEPLAPVNDTAWLGANMATTDIDLSLFTDFDPDDFMFTEEARLPTPPDSPDCDSDNTPVASGFSTSNVFPLHKTPSPLSQLLPPTTACGPGQTDGTIDALTQLHLRLHQISALPREPLLDRSNGRCTLIEETIKASQTFIEILRLISQPGPASPTSPVSPVTTTPGWYPSSSPSPAANSSCSPDNACSPSARGPSISASVSLLALACYVRVIQSCRDVLLLLRRVLSPGDAEGGGGCGATPALPALDSVLLLPQITIGSVRPMSSSPRIQVALLAQLLASILDEVRACIGQLVAAAAPAPGGVGGEGGASACAGADARSAADLMRLAEEGVWRDEAELKGQLLAMTQLLA